MSDVRPLSGPVPATICGRRAAVRPLLALRMRRHVDLCRTAAAMCRA